MTSRPNPKLLNDLRICIICDSEFPTWLPYRDGELGIVQQRLQLVGSDLANFLCPACGSFDRERHLVMYFNALDLWTRVSLGAVLHLAPERHFGSLVRDVAASYIAGDLQPKNENEVMVDLTDTIFPDGSFDIVIANHVFEHIRNDAAAFRETARILRPGGVAIVNTPYSPIIQSSLECADLKDEELLNFLFGQEDHVRIYGTDFFDKLRAVGLEVQLASHVDVLTQSPLKYGVNEQEPLIMAFKP